MQSAVPGALLHAENTQFQRFQNGNHLPKETLPDVQTPCVHTSVSTQALAQLTKTTVAQFT